MEEATLRLNKFAADILSLQMKIKWAKLQRTRIRQEGELDCELVQCGFFCG